MNQHIVKMSLENDILITENPSRDEIRVTDCNRLELTFTSEEAVAFGMQLVTSGLNVKYDGRKPGKPDRRQAARRISDKAKVRLKAGTKTKTK